MEEKVEEKVVYHYCSTEVFHKIISNQKIRLSDITKSNDSMELKWAAQYIKEIFGEKYNNEAKATKYFRENYPEDLYEDLLTRYMEDTFDDDSRYYSFYVCCFSKEGDCLSQWRGYADDGKGLSIGFDESVLSAMIDRLSSQYDMLYGAVTYNEVDQKNEIKREAQKLIEEIKKIAKEHAEKIISETDRKKKSMTEFNKVFLSIFRRCVFLKNPFFREEKETRLCLNESKKALDEEVRKILKELAKKRVGIIDDEANRNIIKEESLSKIEYYCRNSALVPFYDLSFDRGKAIKEVIIGPKCKASENDVETYLFNNGFRGIKVRKSNGTYQ